MKRMKISLPTLVIGALVVVILLSSTFVQQVAFDQVAVRVRLGKADESSVLRDAGLYARWPAPIDHIELYDTRLKALDIRETEVKTVDGKNVILGSYVIWKIADPLLFYRSTLTHKVEAVEEQMRPLIAEKQAAVVGRRTLAQFVNLNAAETDRNYDTLLQEMRDLLSPILATNYGIRVEEIGLRRISLPTEVTQKVFDSMRQERQKLVARYQAEGQSRAEAIRGRADNEARQIIPFAAARAAEIRSAGERAAGAILAQIPKEDQEFYEWLRWLDALKAALQQRTTIFLDERSPLFAPFVRPPVAPDGQPELPTGTRP